MLPSANGNSRQTNPMAGGSDSNIVTSSKSQHLASSNLPYPSAAAGGASVDDKNLNPNSKMNSFDQHH